jgi:tetratricopeptide (TPR) repeat protein
MAAAHLRADILNTYGLLLEWRGDDEGAEQQIAAARDIFEDVKAPIAAAMCTLNLGALARNQGDFGRSLNLISEAEQVLEQYGHYAFHANAHFNLAVTYAAFGYLEPAKEHCERALSILSEDESAPQRVTPKLLLARLIAHENHEQSEQVISEVYEQAIEGDMQFDAAMALLYRGEVLAQLDRHTEALADYNRSYEKLVELQLVQTQWFARIGIAESLTALERTEWATNELLALPEGDHLVSSLRWRYYATVARLCEFDSRQTEAYENYVKALQVARDARRNLSVENQIAHFVQSLTPLFTDAQNRALQNNNTLGALTLTELHGAQLMSVRWGRDFLAEHRPDDLLSLTRNSLNQKAGDGWTVLRYSWHGDQPGVFVITPDHLEYVPIQLDGLKLFLKACTRPTKSDRRFAYLGELASHADPKAKSIEMRRSLYEAFIPKSVQKRLDPDELLVIIPSGCALHGLSFQALLSSRGPLVDQATILYAQSLDMLRISLDEGTSDGLRGRGLVFSQSTFDQKGYDPLLHADEEGQIVAGYIPAQAYHLRGNGNSRETLLALAQSGEMKSYNWLHFATHAFADEETGAFTGLITGHDVLALDDIRGWQLEAQLVTLSACQTGMGEYYYGDEIAGLAQAFQSAHANSVVATLWLVPDDTHVVKLMGEFYQGLAGGNSPAYALAHAQRNANQDGLAPYYWAAYSAFGCP